MWTIYFVPDYVYERASLFLLLYKKGWNIAHPRQSNVDISRVVVALLLTVSVYACMCGVLRMAAWLPSGLSIHRTLHNTGNVAISSCSFSTPFIIHISFLGGAHCEAAEKCIFVSSSGISVSVHTHSRIYTNFWDWMRAERSIATFFDRKTRMGLNIMCACMYLRHIKPFAIRKNYLCMRFEKKVYADIVATLQLAYELHI